jgi:hypothetical protein
MKFTTPIALFIFNRPDTTFRVFNVIAQIKPQKLYIVADGPRNATEATLCNASRSVIKQITWNCDVATCFSETNLGCKLRVSSGLNWIFEQCEEAIILEDDCLPHPTFFPYCAELLERYRDVEKIHSIGGTNFQFGRNRGTHSYYFSHFSHVWGWASWRRAWQLYDLQMAAWPALRESNWLLELWQDTSMVNYWRGIFDAAHLGTINSWDYQWLFASWQHYHLNIVPNSNLISNIGFGENATHTREASNKLSNMKTASLNFPLKHPSQIVIDKEADRFTMQYVFNYLAGKKKNSWRKLLQKQVDTVLNIFQKFN